MGDSGLRAALQETMAGLMATDQVGLGLGLGWDILKDDSYQEI